MSPEEFREQISSLLQGLKEEINLPGMWQFDMNAIGDNRSIDIVRSTSHPDFGKVYGFIVFQNESNARMSFRIAGSTCELFLTAELRPEGYWLFMPVLPTVRDTIDELWTRFQQEQLLVAASQADRRAMLTNLCQHYCRQLYK